MAASLKLTADGRSARQLPFVERFALSYEVDAATGCHLWARARNNRGYGVIWFEGKVRLAHRVAWYLAHGGWPDADLVLDHECEVKRCVNAVHLRETTSGFNIQRAPASPMNVYRDATECRNGHAYPEDVRRDKNGWRVCELCPSRKG